MNGVQKFLPVLILTMGLFSSTSYAQTEVSEEASELHLFRGGYMDMNLALNLNTIGSSLGSGGMGGLITSSVDNGAWSINLNPAHLAGQKKGYISFDTRVGLGTALIQPVNEMLIDLVNDKIDIAVNEEFSNTSSWTQFPETYIRPTEMSNLDVGFNTEISSVAFAAPIGSKFVLAGAYTYPVSMNLDMGVTGLAAKLAQEQGTDEVAIRFDVLMNVSLLAKMRLRMSTMSIGGGFPIIDSKRHKLNAGFTLTRYQVNNVRSLQADLSGMVVVGGADERYFNNPNDPNLNSSLGESNSFFMNAYGEFEATEYGFRTGIHYSLNNSFNVSLVYNQIPKFSLEGKNKEASAFLPVFMVGSGKQILEGDIEVALDSLQANKPNLTTERDISDIVNDGAMELPSAITLGLDFKLGKHTGVINYSRFNGNLSLQHGGDIIGKSATHGVGLGFDFRMRDRFVGFAQVLTLPVRLLFLDFDGILLQSLGKYTGYTNSHYRFGVNVLLGDAYTTLEDQGLIDILNLPMPQSFSMGRQYTILNNVDVGVTVLAVPDIMLKYSLGFRF